MRHRKSMKKGEHPSKERTDKWRRNNKRIIGKSLQY